MWSIIVIATIDITINVKKRKGLEELSWDKCSHGESHDTVQYSLVPQSKALIVE